MNTHIQSIVDRVSAHYGITSAELLARDRSKSVTEARMVAMWICRERFEMSYPEIGRAFGRDHTTVMSAIAKMSAASGLTLLNRETLFREAVQATPQLGAAERLGAAE